MHSLLWLWERFIHGLRKAPQGLQVKHTARNTLHEDNDIRPDAKYVHELAAIDALFVFKFAISFRKIDKLKAS